MNERVCPVSHQERPKTMTTRQHARVRFALRHSTHSIGSIATLFFRTLNIKHRNQRMRRVANATLDYDSDSSIGSSGSSAASVDSADSLSSSGEARVDSLLKMFSEPVSNVTHRNRSFQGENERRHASMQNTITQEHGTTFSRQGRMDSLLTSVGPDAFWGCPDTLELQDKDFSRFTRNMETGQVYAVYETAIPPPNITAAGKRAPYEKGKSNPMLSSMLGYDPNKPHYNKRTETENRLPRRESMASDVTNASKVVTNATEFNVRDAYMNQNNTVDADFDSGRNREQYSGYQQTTSYNYLAKYGSWETNRSLTEQTDTPLTGASHVAALRTREAPEAIAEDVRETFEEGLTGPHTIRPDVTIIRGAVPIVAAVRGRVGDAPQAPLSAHLASGIDATARAAEQTRRSEMHDQHSRGTSAEASVHGETIHSRQLITETQRSMHVSDEDASRSPQPGVHAAASHATQQRLDPTQRESEARHEEESRSITTHVAHVPIVRSAQGVVMAQRGVSGCDTSETHVVNGHLPVAQGAVRSNASLDATQRSMEGVRATEKTYEGFERPSARTRTYSALHSDDNENAHVVDQGETASNQPAPRPIAGDLLPTMRQAKSEDGTLRGELRTHAMGVRVDSAGDLSPSMRQMEEPVSSAHVSTATQRSVDSSVRLDEDRQMDSPEPLKHGGQSRTHASVVRSIALSVNKFAPTEADVKPADSQEVVSSSARPIASAPKGQHLESSSFPIVSHVMSHEARTKVALDHTSTQREEEETRTRSSDVPGIGARVASVECIDPTQREGAVPLSPHDTAVRVVRVASADVASPTQREGVAPASSKDAAVRVARTVARHTAPLAQRSDLVSSASQDHRAKTGDVQTSPVRGRPRQIATGRSAMESYDDGAAPRSSFAAAGHTVRASDKTVSSGRVRSPVRNMYDLTSHRSNRDDDPTSRVRAKHITVKRNKDQEARFSRTQGVDAVVARRAVARSPNRDQTTRVERDVESRTRVGKGGVHSVSPSIRSSVAPLRGESGTIMSDDRNAIFTEADHFSKYDRRVAAGTRLAADRSHDSAAHLTAQFVSDATIVSPIYDNDRSSRGNARGRSPSRCSIAA